MTAEDDLSLDKDWRIGEKSFAVLINTLESVAPRVIVEFGSGASSIRLALSFPDAEIYAIEHDPDYATRTCALQRTYGIRNLTVQLRPLRWQFHRGGVYRSYSPGEMPLSIDAVVVDGPPYFVHLGREACLYQVVNNLRLGGIVLLDDCSRRAEQWAVEHWLANYPNSFVRTDIAVGHGICVLVSNSETEYVFCWRLLFDNYRAAVSRIMSAIREFHVRK